MPKKVTEGTERSYRPDYAPLPSCGYVPCGDRAICHIWTKTGWLWVCHAHYAQTPHTPRISTSPEVEEIRKAYRASQAFSHKQAQPAFISAEDIIARLRRRKAQHGAPSSPEREAGED